MAFERPDFNTKCPSSIEQAENTTIENDSQAYLVNMTMRKNFFPEKLRKMLTSPDYKDLIRWSEDGKSFYFLDRDKFIEKTCDMKNKNKATKNKNLTRKLNRWGFRMHFNEEINGRVYSNILFQRDKPWLSSMMVAEKNDCPQNIESSSQDKTIKKTGEKRNLPSAPTCGFEYCNLDQLRKKRRTSHGLETAEPRQDLSQMETMLIKLLAIDKEIAKIEFLIEEKIQSARSNPSLLKRMYEIQRLFFCNQMERI